jgi:hypothetical protein
MPFAAVRWSLMALSVNSDSCLEWSLSAHSGHCWILARIASVAIDPTATSAVHCGNGFDAGFSPYQITRLSR